MKRIIKIPIGRLIVMTFSGLCLILLAVGGLLVVGLRSVDQETQTQQHRALDKLAVIDDESEEAGNIQAGLLHQLFAPDRAELLKVAQATRDLAETNAVELADYARLIDSPNERRLFDGLMAARHKYWTETDRLMALVEAGADHTIIEKAMETQIPLFEDYDRKIDLLVTDVENSTRQAASSVSSVIATVKNWSDVLIGLAVILCVGAGFAVLEVSRRLREDNTILQREVVERKNAERRLSLEYAITRATADSTAFSGPKVLQIMCQSLEQELGMLWMLDRREHVLRCAASWSNSQVLAAGFCALNQSTTFARGKGLVGAVWAKAEPVHVTDLQSDPSFSDARSAGEAGLREAICFPVFGESAVIGVVALFGRGAGRVDAQLNQTCEAVGHQLGRAFEHGRIQEHLLQSQKMETVGKLAGGIAHEFNSIMTAIIGQSELLLQDLAPDDPLSRNAGEIARAAERAAGLTRQLLAYGRKQMLRPEVLDLDKLISGMSPMLGHIMGKNVEVKLAQTPGKKSIRADSGQIEQVVINIAMNAADAMPNGGKLVIETSSITLDADYVSRVPELAPGQYVLLAINDTGTGMSEEVRNRAFDPFFTTKDVGKGTGLGLATVQGIVKQSNGHISVYSEVGRGSTFKIYLPQVELQKSALPAAPAGRGDMPHGNETILMVEDDPAMREMAANWLKRLGYRVLSAADGVEALNITHQPDIGHIDLLFTDVVMPNMSGKELSERTRSIHPRTKILFTSAYTENAIVNQGILDPKVTLLPKPFTPAALARKIRATLDAPAPDPSGSGK